ncbi:MAG: HD-GYP domain-containing protein [Bacillota bacterium]|jgi:putative nucleotidyltransferase with HDIG domain|nr:HD-GYP domain-containing protein [Candidatus Fermentithermobacillaceae bacterium]
MRVVALHDKLAGESLAMPVHGDGGRLMLARGMKLTPVLIDVLRRRGYTRVALEDSLTDDMEIDESIQEETRQMTISVMDTVMKNIVRGTPGDVRPIKDAIDAIIADLRDNPKATIGLYSLCAFDEETYTHSINVCVLSLSAAGVLGWSVSQLKDLGLGALLHDVGKVLIPKHIINKPALLTDEEYDLVKTHSMKGFELLQQCYNIGPVIAHSALDHHERLDGSGYPRQVKGDSITDFGRMVAVADVYEAMTADRPQRRAVLPEAVQAFLMEKRGTLFDGDMVEAMFKRVALYPTGTILSLWGGYVGVVVKQDPRANHRPVVRIVSGPGIHRATDIALYERPEMTINMILDDYPPETRRLISDMGDIAETSGQGETPSS